MQLLARQVQIVQRLRAEAAPRDFGSLPPAPTADQPLKRLAWAASILAQAPALAEQYMAALNPIGSARPRPRP